MAVLSKPKARVNKLAPDPERQKSVEGNSFVFSDNILSWCTGKSLSTRKVKARF
jgi:hypothetical protein